jgi:hypothetical protein
VKLESALHAHKYFERGYSGTDCYFCVGDGNCPEGKVTKYGKFCCMREKGHGGDHVACVGFADDHAIERWPNEQDAAEVQP